jgi:hypothetical protein
MLKLFMTLTHSVDYDNGVYMVLAGVCENLTRPPQYIHTHSFLLKWKAPIHVSGDAAARNTRCWRRPMKPNNLACLATIALAVSAFPSVAPSQNVSRHMSAPVSVAQNSTTSTSTLLSFNKVVETRIRPQTGRLLELLAAGGRTTNLDGIPVFNGSDKFLTGKIAIGYAEFIEALPANDPSLPRHLADFGKIAKMTIDDPNDSWGIYYYLVALKKLKKAGYLDRAVDRLSLAKLRVRLDWRTFMDRDTLELIDHPNNYKCVAFAIARLRAELGWESLSEADRIYNTLGQHYNAYSGFGFADETDGEGRFDRYSVLLAGEIANHFVQSGVQPTDEVKGWLRKSADVMLMRINAKGEGWEYGRSIGPYGETAIIETLTAAASSGVLTQAEMDMAYAYATIVANRYINFWLDPATGSVNLWDKGRRTDAYRGKFRIFGENLSLAHQFSYTNAVWNRLGYKDRAPIADFEKRLAQRPLQAITWFKRGEYDRLLFTRRDRSHTFGLPLINGGRTQHMNTPYFPVPFARGIVESMSDGKTPQLVPRFTLANDDVLMPLAFFKNIQVSTKGRTTSVTTRQDELNKMGTPSPIKDGRLRVTTRFDFRDGEVSRTDVYTPTVPIDLKKIELEFAGFSQVVAQKANTITLGQGAATEFKVEGLENCTAENINDLPDYRSDTGAMTSLVRCQSGPKSLDKPFSISWRLKYN